MKSKNGEEWLMKISSILRVVQNQDAKRINHQDIYYALDVVKDMLPDEKTANKMFDVIKEEKFKVE